MREWQPPHCTSQWGRSTLWGGMCTVRSSHSTWLSKQSNKSAQNFMLSLNFLPGKLFRWFRRLQLWATGDSQLHHNNVPTHVSHLVQFLAKHQIIQVTHSGPLQPQFGTLQLLAFPKTKITFEREEISDCQRDSGKYDSTADGYREKCVRSQGAYFEGDWGVIVQCTVFLVSCIVFNKCLYFSSCMAGYLLDRPCTSVHNIWGKIRRLGWETWVRAKIVANEKIFIKL